MSFDRSELLIPEAVLPEQVDRRPRDAMQPEKRLMLAVLENAVWLLLYGGSARSVDTRRHAAEAARWLASDAIHWPFAFVNVCHALGLEPAWVRSGIVRGAGTVHSRAAGSPTPHFPFRRVVGVRRRLRGRSPRRRAARG